MDNLVKIKNDKVLTSSLKIASVFGKKHSRILRAIKNLGCSDGFRLLNFELSTYISPQNKKIPFYKITKKGFILLAMSFTGEFADIIKERIVSGVSFDIDIDSIDFEVDYTHISQKTYIMIDKKNKLVKIGKSKTPRFREKTLQSEKPTIELLCICEKLVESEIHNEYDLYRVRGEWFRLNNIQLQNIISNYNFKAI